MLKQDGTKTTPLEVIGDVECYLRLVPLDAVKPGDPDDRLCAVRLNQSGDNCDPIDVVGLRKPAQVSIGQASHRGKEPHVRGALRLAQVEGLEQVLVTWPDGANVRGRSVAQDNVCFPVRWVCGDLR